MQPGHWRKVESLLVHVKIQPLGALWKKLLCGGAALRSSCDTTCAAVACPISSADFNEPQQPIPMRHDSNEPGVLLNSELQQPAAQEFEPSLNRTDNSVASFNKQSIAFPAAPEIDPYTSFFRDDFSKSMDKFAVQPVDDIGNRTSLNPLLLSTLTPGSDVIAEISTRERCSTDEVAFSSSSIPTVEPVADATMGSATAHPSLFSTPTSTMLPTEVIHPNNRGNRWTNHAKRGFYFQKKQRSDSETLRTHAARISRKATSIALKCSVSKELLDDLENAIDKLDLEADNSLSKIKSKAYEVSQSSNECVGDILNGKVSIRVPPIINGPKNKRSKTVLEKKNGKTANAAKKKGEDPKKSAGNGEMGQAPDELIGSFDANVGVDMHGDFSAMVAPSIHGEYTSLLLGLDQDASAARKLHF